jgi:hypothetical protein
MLEQVEEQHKEDEDRFKKLQIQDTATLNDRMDQLIVCRHVNRYVLVDCYDSYEF